MGIIETIVSALTEIVSGSAGAIAEGATNLLLTTGTDGEMVLSNVGIIIFTLFGLGMGKIIAPYNSNVIKQTPLISGNSLLDNPKRSLFLGTFNDYCVSKYAQARGNGEQPI